MLYLSLGPHRSQHGVTQQNTTNNSYSFVKTSNHISVADTFFMFSSFNDLDSFIFFTFSPMYKCTNVRRCVGRSNVYAYVNVYRDFLERVN
jgi:hypothetical protein